MSKGNGSTDLIRDSVMPIQSMWAKQIATSLPAEIPSKLRSQQFYRLFNFLNAHQNKSDTGNTLEDKMIWDALKLPSKEALPLPSEEREEMRNMSTTNRDEKYFDKYLDSRLSNIEVALTNQSDKMTVMVSSLEKLVDRTVTENAATKKELADNMRWSNRLIIGSLIGILALFAGMIYFMISLNYTLSRDSTDIRRDLYQFQQSIHQQVDKMIKPAP